MKNILLLLLALSFSTHADAALLGAPYMPEVDARFNALESSSVQQAGNSGNNFTTYLAKGIINLTNQSLALVSTPVVLPAMAIITQAYIYTETRIAPSGTTLALQCLTANDVLTATDETGNGPTTIYAGAEVGTAATMLFTGSTGCTISAKGGTHTATAGLIDLFIQYVIAN